MKNIDFFMVFVVCQGYNTTPHHTTTLTLCHRIHLQEIFLFFFLFCLAIHSFIHISFSVSIENKNKEPGNRICLQQTIETREKKPMLEIWAKVQNNDEEWLTDAMLRYTMLLNWKFNEVFLTHTNPDRHRQIRIQQEFFFLVLVVFSGFFV